LQSFLFCSLDSFRPRAEIVAKVEIAKNTPPLIFAGRLRFMVAPS